MAFPTWVPRCPSLSTESRTGSSSIPTKLQKSTGPAPSGGSTQPHWEKGWRSGVSSGWDLPEYRSLWRAWSGRSCTRSGNTATRGGSYTARGVRSSSEWLSAQTGPGGTRPALSSSREHTGFQPGDWDQSAQPSFGISIGQPSLTPLILTSVHLCLF